MKKYLLTVDGFVVGVVELSPLDVKALESDKDIIIKSIK